jgi:hypothetical protein
VRYFIVRHLQRTLAGLTRRYSARAALGQQADGEQQDREAVREFQQSLPPDRQKIYVLLLIAAIFIVFGRIITWLVDSYETKPGNSEIQQLKDASTKIVGALNADARATNDAVNAVLSSGPLGWCLLTLGVMLSAYVVLRPLIVGCQVKGTTSELVLP